MLSLEATFLGVYGVLLINVLTDFHSTFLHCILTPCYIFINKNMCLNNDITFQIFIT